MSLLDVEQIRNVPSPQLEEVPLADFNGVSLAVVNNEGSPEKGELIQVESKHKNEDMNDRTRRIQEDEATRRIGSAGSSFASLGADLDLDIPECDEDARKFFTARDSLIDRAVHDIEKKVIDLDSDGSLIDAWLLTVVDHWDHEKERLVILCQNAIFLVKYDFIALYVADYCRLELKAIDRLTVGKLQYPSRSIAPKVHEAASKAGTFFKNVLKQLGEGVGRSGGILNFTSSVRPQPAAETVVNDQKAVVESSTQPERYGVRIYWCSGRQPLVSQLWNPWSADIPWTTIISHPLLQKRGKRSRTFDVEDFVLSLRRFIQRRNESVVDPLHRCLIDESPIIMESYLGISSLVHNFGEFGYFKVRGKFSF